MNRATEVNLLAPWASHLPSDWGRCRLDAVADVFERSVNVSSPHSDLRIQLQTDPRYQEFIPRAELKEVLGYKMVVAKLEDVLQGKVWAYMDQSGGEANDRKIWPIFCASSRPIRSLGPSSRKACGRNWKRISFHRKDEDLPAPDGARPRCLLDDFHRDETEGAKEEQGVRPDRPQARVGEGRSKSSFLTGPPKPFLTEDTEVRPQPREGRSRGGEGDGKEGNVLK